jgi:hypothetical protein
MGYFGSILSMMVWRIPLILALSAGLVFAIVRREKHGRISLLGGIYFGLSILIQVAGALVSFLPIFAREIFDISLVRIGMLTSMYGYLAAFLEAGLAILLIFAIFGERADLED